RRGLQEARGAESAARISAWQIVGQAFPGGGLQPDGWARNELAVPVERVLSSRRVALPDGVRPAAIHIRDGKIARVTDQFDRTGLDFGDLVIMPGLVDTHVHINQPGRTDWEGFTTATKAAAAGGITTLVEMPL